MKQRGSSCLYNIKIKYILYVNAYLCSTITFEKYLKKIWLYRSVTKRFFSYEFMQSFANNGFRILKRKRILYTIWILLIIRCHFICKRKISVNEVISLIDIWQVEKMCVVFLLLKRIYLIFLLIQEPHDILLSNWNFCRFIRYH